MVDWTDRDLKDIYKGVEKKVEGRLRYGWPMHF